ncbi:MAG TPA: hypothetical protein VH396_19645 [Chitinophagaceae bacterium]|jgi:hypothetical protein
MKKETKIEPVITKVFFDEEDNSDLFFWSDKSIAERMNEMFEWNKKIWTAINGMYPAKIERIVEVRKKAETDEDDF